HAEIAVVDQGDLDREALHRGGGQLLVGHLEATITVDGPDLLFRCSGLRAEGGWHGVTHGAQATGVEPGAWFLEVDELGGPHLVLAHAGAVDGVRSDLTGEGLDDILRGQGAVVLFVITTGETLSQVA